MREGLYRLRKSTVNRPTAEQGGDEQVQLIFTITKEARKQSSTKIVVNGVTGSAAVHAQNGGHSPRHSAFSGRRVLRADRKNEAERALYVTDAFRQVLISQARPATGRMLEEVRRDSWT